MLKKIAFGALGVLALLWAASGEDDSQDAALEAFRVIPDDPAGLGLRSQTYHAYFSGTIIEKKTTAAVLVSQGYKKAARYLDTSV